MTDDEIELIHSPLTQTHSAEGQTLGIEIYRSRANPGFWKATTARPGGRHHGATERPGALPPQPYP